MTDLGSTWDDCDNLVSHPGLDMTNVTWATNMLQDCPSLTHVGPITGAPAANISRMFQNCTALTCLHSLNTTNATTTTDMFTNTPLLTAPTAGEQTDLATVPPGLNYVNAGACP